MINHLKIQMRNAFKIAIASTPLVISMYLLYWLGKHEIWLPETLHRDKITIAVLVAGMALSFFLQSYFAKRKQK
ncbi:MAG: hypothetical protein HRT37_01440 [Alteromonadaceae bacterium]|nr:hypothetical protein [Alteromonadaceae bacterium]